MIEKPARLEEELASWVLENKKPIRYPLGYFSDGFTITTRNHLWVATRGNRRVGIARQTVTDGKLF